MSKWKKDVELRLETLEKEVSRKIGRLPYDGIDDIRKSIRELNEQVFGLYNIGSIISIPTGHSLSCVKKILRMLLDYFNLEVVDTPAETKLQQRKKDAEKKSK